MAATKKTSAKKVKKEATEQVNSVVEQVKENIDSAQELTLKVWYANLGVYGRVYEEVTTRVAKVSDEVRDRVEQLNSDREDLIADLIKRGEKVQGDVEGYLKEGRSNLDDQVAAAKARFSKFSPFKSLSAGLKEASDKLEDLSEDLKAA